MTYYLKQRGVVIPIVVIGLLAMLAVAGLAIDGSHALANKTRAQNTVDAAALAAAKVLDETGGDIAPATAAANSLFSINADAAGNHELNRAYDAGDITVTVQYSTTVNPFIPGAPAGPFVRVIATGFDTATTLSRVLSINDISTPATAVAGPSGPLGSGEGANVCDIAPIAVCNGDNKGADAVPPFGFVTESLTVLKPGPGNHGDIGPGNYKMLRLGCNGGSCLRHNLAGSYDDCQTVGDYVETEPGVSSGPTSQGFNTRFGIYQGGGMNSEDYPPDRVTTEQDPDILKACEDDSVDPPVDHIYMTSAPGKNYCKHYDPVDVPWVNDEVLVADDINYSYDEWYYDSLPPNTFPADSKKNRRVLAFPVVECTGNQNGQSSLKVLGFTCLFMLQSLPSGQNDGGGKIIGEFIDSCEVNGTAGNNPPGANPLLYKIQLYKNADSRDS
ncbi:MAG: Tad domain-containing protein [Gammaproteobacteria bacterium]|nr:Tad domain-containing protein [Gammaproteobacteria bacterium]MBU2675621.1 Tad domain-containing protein [Gammaproteobacteria bacterium]NNC56580.1 Tad domain-containing protein [Woeseiaceae bacterium]NNL49356.1 Tad domain-containing protein [Woeseiaceae bacterium]